MKDWIVSYYLMNMYHVYTLEAKDAQEAQEKVERGLPEECRKIFRFVEAKPAPIVYP